MDEIFIDLGLSWNFTCIEGIMGECNPIMDLQNPHSVQRH